jgi:hypothetical protein
VTDSDPTLIPLSALAWPISYRWHIQTPFGAYNTELCVDAGELVDDVEASAMLGRLLFSSAIAVAITRHCRPTIQEMICWKVGDAPSAIPLTLEQGFHFATAAARNETGVMVLHTGHADGRARRRIFFGGMPASWADDGLLSRPGAERLQEVGRGWICGLVAGSGSLPARLLIAYPRSVPLSGGIGEEVGFRTVETVRVCQFTERCPDLGGMIWPQPG